MLLCSSLMAQQIKASNETINFDQVAKEDEFLPEEKQVILENSKCSKYEDFKYCIFPGTGLRSREIIYYFHGIFGNEKQWMSNSITKKIYKEFMGSPQGSPTIVNISYGSVWLLTPKNSKGSSGLLDFWSSENLKKFERENFSEEIKTRYVFGDSMGGHNGFAFYLKNQSLFKKAILICPAGLVASPYEESKVHKEKLTADFHGNWTMYLGVMGLMSLYYDDITYKKSAPYEILAHTPSSKINVSIIGVDNDMYGFSDVAKTFIKQQRPTIRKVFYEQDSGSHCYPANIQALVEKFR